MSEETQQHEAALDQIIDQVLVLSENPQKDDALIQRLEYDLATKVHPPEEIARRYGFLDVEELGTYLELHPQIVWEVKKLRAMFESPAGLEARMRMKFQYATEDLIPFIHDIAKSPNVPTAQRIDGFKQLQRGAGMDGVRDKGNEGQTGQKFVLNILFGGDQGADAVINGTVIDNPETIPGPPSLALAGTEEPDEEADV